MSKPFKLGELFCGCGGIGLGALSARLHWRGHSYSYEIAWATDWDKDACQTYRRNLIPDRPEAVICEDIRKLDLRRLRDISEVDVLAFGFPCNDFSVIRAGRKGIKGEYGALYTYCTKALTYFQPAFFVAENVKGLISANNGEALQVILKDFAGAGYTLTTHLYKMEEYGIPQTRHRVVIVGVRNDLGVRFRVPSPEPYSKMDNSARKAIEEPPIPADAPNHDFIKHKPEVIERLKYIPSGGDASTPNIPEWLRLSGPRVALRYMRLPLNGPSYTICGSGHAITAYHWSEPRALTNRELARLQMFPDWFVFEGNRQSVRQQIGMAVPPRFALIIFEALLMLVARKTYESVTPNIAFGPRLVLS